MIISYAVALNFLVSRLFLLLKIIEDPKDFVHIIVSLDIYCNRRKNQEMFTILII